MKQGVLGYPLERELDVADLGYPFGNIDDGEEAIPSLPPITDLAGWWDASAFDTLTIASDLVSQWNDRSAAGNNATQATSGARPGYGGARDRRINRWTVLDFDRGDGMSTALSVDISVLSSFVVADVDLIGSGASVTMLWSSSGGWPIFYTGTPDGLLFQSAGTTASMISPYPRVGVPAVYGVIWDAPAVTFVNNDTRYASSATDAGSTGTLEIGSRGGGQPFDGGMGELLFYTRALSAAEVNRTTDYLMRKWNIT